MQVWLKPPGADDNIPGTAEDLLKLATGGVAQVFRYWDRKRGARAMPSADDIDFLELRPWLSGIMLIEVVPGEACELIYRVVGERAVRQRGYDPSGMSVRQAAHGDRAAAAVARYTAVVDQKAPVFSWGQAKLKPGQNCNTLALPLSRDGAIVDRILVYGEDQAAAS